VALDSGGRSLQVMPRAATFTVSPTTRSSGALFSDPVMRVAKGSS
jgi:hypothetical protein